MDLFVSYRRNDVPEVAATVAEGLQDRLPWSTVFLDKGSIAPGEDFPEVLQARVRASEAVIVVIGPEWASAENLERLQHPNDWVRRELQLALTARKKIIPLLVDGAQMPDEGLLPTAIAALHRKNAVVAENLSRGIDKTASELRKLGGQQALALRLSSIDAVGRTEADLQSDVKILLLEHDLGLENGDLSIQLEAPTETGRIDVKVGRTVFELKRDLRVASRQEKAADQLAEYLSEREEATGQSFLGVLTDGRIWLLGVVDETHRFRVVHRLTLDARQPDLAPLVELLRQVMPTQSELEPAPQSILGHFGASSVAFQLDLARLERLWALAATQPPAQLKRELWDRLLTAALGTKFQDNDRLFVEHTYLVLMAELIAHAVMDFDLSLDGLEPQDLVQGKLFDRASIAGVVEEDFFDWVLDVPEGPAFIRSLATRVSRFTWKYVEHDVLKILYESVIDASQRKDLGEHYTPDWLAGAMVESVVTEPLSQRVLDPSCGSGTFLFHAIRSVAAAHESEGKSAGEIVKLVCEQVTGIDLHPVAVTLARVTYLLALGADRLRAKDRPAVSVPVYLGDSLLWRHDEGILSREGLSVFTTDHAELFHRELHFPRSVLSNSTTFDRLVEAMARRARDRENGSKPPSLTRLYKHHGVAADAYAALDETFQTMCVLNDQGRDHIWSYYVRNLARPLWLSEPDRRVDVLVGNPPWIAARYLPEETKEQMALRMKERGLRRGRDVGPQHNLAAYFVARSIELFLKQEGQFAFVMPESTLRGTQYAPLRTGLFNAPTGTVGVRFSTAWDISELEPNDFFPVPACVVHGERRDNAPTPLGLDVEQWHGKIGRVPGAWPDIQPRIERTIVTLTERSIASTYAARAKNGANIYPRVLTFVDETPPGPLGAGPDGVEIVTQPSSDAGSVWKEVEPQLGAVERRFLFQVVKGAAVAPFKILDSKVGQAALPIVEDVLVECDDDRLSDYPAAAEWFDKIERLWRLHRPPSARNKSFRGQIDDRRKLGQQLPVAAHRVVFPKSGMTLPATYVADRDLLIENTAYSIATSGVEEALYLTAVLNSGPLLSRVAPLQGKGQFGRRDFNKIIFSVAIPAYDDDLADHRKLVELAEEASKKAALLEAAGDFKKQRSYIAAELRTLGPLAEIDRRVEDLLK